MDESRLVRRLIPFLALTLVASLPAAAQDPPKQDPPPPPQSSAVTSGKAQSGATASDDKPKFKQREGKVLLPPGTKLPLVLHNSISTRGSKSGDPVYFETLFPVLSENKVVIPAGSYVSGEVVETKRPGRVKGRGELSIRLNTLIMPNGYTVDFNAIPTGAGTGGNETVEQEGKIKGDSDKGNDVGTVVKTTGLGAGIGGIAGRSGAGAGIGAAAGAAVGLMAVLLSRGPEVELPRGTTLDVMLDRPLYLDADKVQFTDPGRASSLAGAPNRQAPRTRFP